MWIIPSELNDALKGLGTLAGAAKGITEEPSSGGFSAPVPVDVFAEIEAQKKMDAANSAASVQQAIAEAEALEGKRAARLASPGLDNAITTGLLDPVTPPAPTAAPVIETDPGVIG
jgi:hypothetical protein